MYRRLAYILIAFTLLLPLQAVADPQILADFAGTGDMGIQDGPLLKATFSLPMGMAFDKDGSLLVVDSYNNRIRKISKDTVSTLTGFTDQKDAYSLPLEGFSDGDLLTARFNKPRDIVVDSRGIIFVSDTGNNVIRGISDGKVFTFAGNGKAGYADGNQGKVQFNCPSGLAIDSSDNIYVADSLNNVIRKITPTGEVTTYCGKFSANGSYKDGTAMEAQFNEPSDITVSSKGDLYVLDSGNQLIRKVSENRVSTIYGSRTEALEGTGYYQGNFRDGYGSEARFNFPKGITLVDDDVLLIADTWNHRVRAITPNGKVLTIAGFGIAGRDNGSPSESKFNGPASILYKDGTLYIADMWNNCIRKMPLDLASLKQSNELSGISFDAPKAAPQLWYNKLKLEIPEDSIYITKNRIMVPLEYICEALAFKITSGTEKDTVEISNGSMSKEFKVDNEHLIMKDGIITVQLRYLVEAFGFNIEWLQKYRAIVIYNS
jgi:sugar lactone lactonase YvrE